MMRWDQGMYRSGQHADVAGVGRYRISNTGRAYLLTLGTREGVTRIVDGRSVEKLKEYASAHLFWMIWEKTFN